MKTKTRHNCIIAMPEPGERGLPVRALGEVVLMAPPGAAVDYHIARLLGAVLVVGLPEDLDKLLPEAEAEARARAKRAPDPHKTLSDEAKTWLAIGEHGSSSRALFAATTGVTVKGLPHSQATPRDADDFRRCALLYESVTEVREKLHQAREMGPVWASLVDRWDDLMALYEEGDAEGVNELLEELVPNVPGVLQAEEFPCK